MIFPEIVWAQLGAWCGVGANLTCRYRDWSKSLKNDFFHVVFFSVAQDTYLECGKNTHSRFCSLPPQNG